MQFKIIITFLFLHTLSQAGNISLTGNCACNGVMSSTFSKIDDFIVDDNLKVFNESLEKFIKKKEVKLEKLKNDNEQLLKLIEQNKNDVAYLMKIAFLLKQEIQIRKNHKIE